MVNPTKIMTAILLKNAAGFSAKPLTIPIIAKMMIPNTKIDEVRFFKKATSLRAS
jgi:hypothetical protein